MTEPRPDDIHVIAIDWSGAAQGGAQDIWLAEVHGGLLVRLENGRTRQQVAKHLIQLAEENPYMVVGLDFAFSFPAWFVEMHGLSDAVAMWGLASRNATAWLSCCPWPFWGYEGTREPEYIQVFRRTEQDVQVLGLGTPKSVFHIYGPGTVGTGSLRGMPVLRRLHEAGFWIWPFPKGEAPGWPRVVEIYPRALVGADDVSDPPARLGFIDNNYPNFPPQHRTTVANNRDAFDAAVSALVMWNNLQALMDLAPTANRQILLEGQIWYP